MIKKITISEIYKFLTILLTAFPLLTFLMRSILIILWTFIGLLLFLKSQPKKNKTYSIVLFIIPFIILCFSLFYSENLKEGIHTLTKMLPLIIIPFILFLNREFFDKKKITSLLYVFSYSTLILVIYIIVMLIFNYNNVFHDVTIEQAMGNGYKTISEIPDDIKKELNLRRFRDFTIKKTRTHTTYQGLFVCFSIFFLVTQSFKENKRIIKIYNSITATLLLFWLLAISARMPFLALILGSIFSVFIFYKIKTKHKIFILCSIPVVLILLNSINNPLSVRIKQYYKTGFTLLNKNSQKNDYNSANVRNGIYFCDIELIKKHPIIGVGIGDIQHELNNCFDKKLGAKVYNEHTFNSHNQYAFFWISSGIVGLLSFILVLIRIYVKAIENKDQILFYFVMINTIVFMTENTLVRSDGVIFFSLFSTLLFFNIKKST